MSDLLCDLRNLKERISALQSLAQGMGRQELMLTYDGVRDKNLEQLKTLSRAIFPVRYQAGEHLSMS